MLGSSARRDRRGFWAATSLVLALGVGSAMWAAARAREEAAARATTDARIAAQTRLAPLLTPKDLTAPIVGERAGALGAAIGREVLSVSPIDEVRIYSSGGRILYARDPQIVGTRPSYVRARVSEVAGGQTQSWIRGGLLQTHVPIWLDPGGTVVVAEMSQPFGPLAAEANGTWYGLAIGLGALLIGTLAMTVKAARARVPTPVPMKVAQAPTAPRAERERRPNPQAPVYEHPGFRGLEEARREAERRAEEAEESVQALRDQLRETASRLHEAETDNEALQARVEEAERRAAELTEAMARLEAELESTRSRFHMSMLTAALRELDDDAIQIEVGDGDHDAVAVRRSPLRAGKVR